MGVQKIIVVVEDREVEIKFDITKTLGDLRKTLADQKYIFDDSEENVWRFVKLKDGKTETSNDTSIEQYIPVSVYIYGNNKVCITNLKKALQLFAGALHEYIRFDVSHTLCELRTFLVKKGHIENDDETHGWRFVSPLVDNMSGDLSDAIVGLDGSEKHLRVNDFLYKTNKVRMTNVHSKKNPDLIGVGTTRLTDGHLTVEVTLNYSVTPDKFQPVMMQNVRTSNPNIRSNFGNVVLCEKETAIGFFISVKNHGGYGFSIKPREGDPIAEKLYASHPSCGLSMYATTRKAIQIVSFKDLGIPTQQQVGYRRITVKAWKFISYADGSGNRITVDEKRSYAPSTHKGIDVVPGDSIEGGSAKEGRQTDGTIGTVYDVEDDPDDVLGTVEIDFFVFKTREDAQRMIESRIEPIYD